MSDPNINRPEGNEEQAPGERINQAIQHTGQRLSEELSTAGERVKQFVEEKHVNEQLEVAGNQVVERVKDLIEEGNVRRLILRNPEGRTLLEIPLTAGVAVGGAVLWMNPLLAGLGAIAALIARVTIEIVREEPDATLKDAQDTARQISEDVKDAARNAQKNLGGGPGSGTTGTGGGFGTGGPTGGGTSGGSTSR
jgi:hypothetical protein